MWNLAGIVLASGIAALAWRRSTAPGGFYDAQVYGMTAAVHRRYALTSLAFGLFFAAVWLLGWGTAGVAALGVYAVIAILYSTSFLRGASDDE